METLYLFLSLSLSFGSHFILLFVFIRSFLVCVFFFASQRVPTNSNGNEGIKACEFFIIINKRVSLLLLLMVELVCSTF